MKVILDTNGYSAFLKEDPKARSAIGEAEEVLISVFVLGELYAGFRKGNRMARNLELLKGILAEDRVKVLDATSETAEVFGQAKSSLEKAGTPIPVHAVWIAAQAIQTGSVLITYDRHFLNVPGLRVWDELEAG